MLRKYQTVNQKGALKEGQQDCYDVVLNANTDSGEINTRVFLTQNTISLLY
jgi:hypothetical protein